MSNSYIVQDTSLTAIADTVRSKLGNGESISDAGAGFYPVLQKAVAFLTYERYGSNYSPSGGYEENIYKNTFNQEWQDTITAWCGEEPSKIKFIKKTSGTNMRQIVFYTSANTTTTIFDATAAVDSEKIIDYPQDLNIFKVQQFGYGSYSGTSYTVSQLQIQFLDANGNIYPVATSDTSFTDDYSHTISFLDRNIYVPIPMSLSAIQSNIANYLISSASASKTHFLWYVNHNGTVYGNSLAEMNLNNLITNLSQLKLLVQYSTGSSGTGSFYPTSQPARVYIDNKMYMTSNNSFTNPYNSSEFPLILTSESDYPLGLRFQGVGDQQLKYPQAAFVVYQEA